jgi:hypothetical protein
LRLDRLAFVGQLLSQHDVGVGMDAKAILQEGGHEAEIHAKKGRRFGFYVWVHGHDCFGGLPAHGTRSIHKLLRVQSAFLGMARNQS